MNITYNEKIMYKVMKATYDSGIPISFKGSMVLKACLSEVGYNEDTRHTVDIDGNWCSETPPTAEQMTDSLQKALDKNNVNAKVELCRMYGIGRSAGFNFRDKTTGNIIFTMDIDVNRPVVLTKIYEIEDFHFRGVSPTQIIADKVSAISTDKVFRRVKDVIDLYYLSKVFVFDKTVVLQTVKNNGRTLDTFNGFLHRTEDLQHAYEKFHFAGGVNKPPFDEVYRAVKSYITPVLPNQKIKDYTR